MAESAAYLTSNPHLSATNVMVSYHDMPTDMQLEALSTCFVAVNDFVWCYIVESK
jgi:hypothetical protein